MMHGTTNINIKILRQLSDAVRKKRPEKWRINDWFLLHENGRVHRSVFVKDFLVNKNAITVVVTHTLLATHQLIFTFSLDSNQH
jgi:hypothetical protein